jgi:hypothetical protein
MVKHIRKNFPDVRMHGSFIIGLPDEDINSVLDTHQSLMSGELPLHSFNWKPLRLQKINFANDVSDLDINYPKFGYTLLPDNDSKSITVKWKNPFMDEPTAAKLATLLTNDGNKVSYMNARFAWGLINYGFDMETVSNKKYNDYDWQELSNSKKIFIDNYKNQLFKMLNIY